MKRFWPAFCLVLLPMTAAGEGGTDVGTPEAMDIALGVEHVNRFRSVRDVSYGGGESRMVVVDRPPGQAPRINTLERFRKNDYPAGEVTARDLVIFRGGKLRGTGILVSDHADAQRSSSYVIWIPSLRKLRRFAEPRQADTWSGSNFTYGDIYLRQAADEQHQLLGVEPFPGCLEVMQIPLDQRDRYTRHPPERRCEPEGRLTYKLKSRPLIPDVGYDHRLVWVDRETFADYRSEFYRDGQALKVIDKDWRSMGLEDPRAQYWVYWYVRTFADGHEGMAYVDPGAVSWNDDPDPRLWSEGRLRRIKR